LIVEHIAFHPGRGNVIVRYPGTHPEKVVSFVGSHLDVVPAGDRSKWTHDPFQLVVDEDGEKLYGRGVTDCLGHVALLTELFVVLATKKPELAITVAAVFIANEENSSIEGVGVDELMKHGKIDFLKKGPLYLVDSADTHPCIGTGSAAVWKLEAKGKLFHSGIPDKAINAMELAMESLALIQKRFYADFAAHKEEGRYGFKTSSTMKPTQWHYPGGAPNQIPEECSITGDIRLTPFYDIHKCASQVEKYVQELNENLNSIPTRGPASKYELPAEGKKGTLKLTWLGEKHKGIACNLDSVGYHALLNATRKFFPEAQPYSLTGSLPLIADLKEQGFDVQVTGFGRMDAYHAANEYGKLSEFTRAGSILLHVIQELNKN